MESPLYIKSHISCYWCLDELHILKSENIKLNKLVFSNTTSLRLLKKEGVA